jgi:hypothetical protein
MIWAAAYCGEKDVAPPTELVYFWRCKKYGAPYDGGWMNWPAGLIVKMNKLGYVEHVMNLYRECGKNLTKVKEKHGKQMFGEVAKVIKELHGNHN